MDINPLATAGASLAIHVSSRDFARDVGGKKTMLGAFAVGSLGTGGTKELASTRKEWQA